MQNKIETVYFLADAKKTRLVMTNATGRAVHVTRANETAPLTTVVVEFSGRKSVIPPVHSPRADGVYNLTDLDSDHFLNYNGEGYSDPATTYKEQWDIAVPEKLRYEVVVSYEKPIRPSGVQLTIDGRSLKRPLNSDGSGTITMGTLDLLASPCLKVRLTPPQPFARGTELAAKISRVKLRPVP